MSTARRVLSNTVIQILGKLVTAGVSIIIIKLITNYLGRAGYGEYTTVYEFLAFFGVIADLGIFQIAVREMSRETKRVPEILGNVLALRSLLAVIALVIAAGAAYFVPKYAGTAIPFGIAISTVTTFLALVTSTLSSILQVELQMGRAVVASIIGKFVSLAYMLWVIFYGFTHDTAAGFNQLLIAGIVGNFVMFAATYFYTRPLTQISLRFDFTFWKAVLKKAIPYGAAILLGTVYFRLGILLLSLLRNSEEVGTYGVAVRIIENLQFLTIFFLNSTLPIMTRLLRDNLPKLRLLIQYSFDFLLMLGMPLVAGGFVLAYPLIAIVASPEFLSKLGSGFYGSDVALQILLLAMLFAFLGNLFSFALLAGDQQKKLIYSNAGAVLVSLVLNFTLIPLFGFRGAAFTSIVSEIFVCGITFYFVRQMVGVNLRFRTAGKILLATLLMAASVSFLQPLTFTYLQNKNILVLIPLGGLIYSATLFFAKAITPEMWALLRKPKPALDSKSQP